MSTTPDHQPPGAPAGTGQPSTQEIPVVPPGAPARAATTVQQLPPPGAAPAAGAPVQAAQPTGPVDFVPGLPGLGTPPPPPPPAPASLATEPGPDAPPTLPAPSWPESLEADETPSATPATLKRSRNRPRDLAVVAAPVLAALAVVVLEVGLSLAFGSVSYWSAVTLWSAFATVAALVALLAFAAFYVAGNRLRSSAIWRVAAGGLVGLSVFWVLVVLPDVASDRGFVLTAALACLGGALWIGPRHKH